MSLPNAQVVSCTRCPRLVQWREEVARTKRRAYRDEDYWGRPVPAFGAASARLLVLGLAPGAHGANRTGRVFTGDSSGDWLYRALHAAGFANRAASVRAGDGLKLKGAAVTCAVKCVPPQNRPTREEQEACRPFLGAELAALKRLRVVIALGHLAFDAFLKARGGAAPRPQPRFTPGPAFENGRVTLLGCYNPSRQNTQTGRLTRPMFEKVFRRAGTILRG